jgi:integrase
MPKPFKQTIVEYTLAGKHRLSNGSRVTKDTPGAERKVRRSEGWYGRVNRKVIYLSASRKAAEQILAEKVAEADKAAAGIAVSYDKHLRRLLSGHLEDFEAELRARGNTDKHVRQTVNRARAMVQGCGWVFWQDAQGSAASAWLAEQREAGAIPTCTTSNKYLCDARSFFAWLKEDGRAPRNPLENVRSASTEGDVHRERRILAPAEFAAFLDATRGSLRKFCHLSGTDRFTLYFVAATTGFREGELAGLTPAHFDLEASTATLAASEDKAAKRRVQPLSTGLVALLRDYLAGRNPAQPVWRGTWWNRGARMVELDLASAGLPYRDTAGRYFDFHALRHQYISDLQAVGTDRPTVKELARHATALLTEGTYSHSDDERRREAVEALARRQGAPLTATCDANAIHTPLIQTQSVKAPEMAAAEALKAHKKPRKNRGNAKAPPGFEPGMADLQSAPQNPEVILAKLLAEIDPARLAIALSALLQKGPGRAA